jgi:ribonucleoside-diphosphate reductase alpha chain
MSSTYDFAEPGFILIDRVNEMNNNWWCENIRATNPCVTADTRLATQYGMVPIGELHASGAHCK